MNFAKKRAAKKEYNIWCKNILFDKDIEKLKSLAKYEIYENFYCNIDFGVSGIRSETGIGTNKLNIYTLRRVIASYANWIKKKYKDVENYNQKGVIIIHDNREESKQFAIEATNVLTSNNINVYIKNNNEDSPTGFASCMIKMKKSLGAVVITASHNPKCYNGIKIFYENGAQLLPKQCKYIIENLKNIKYNFLSPQKLNISNNADVIYFDENDENYYKDIAVSSTININEKKVIKIAFSPLYGTTRKIVPNLLKTLNYDYYVVEKESVNDYNYGNLTSLNPEDLFIYKNVLSLAKEKKCSLALICDPDGDRIGLSFLNLKTNAFEQLSSNKTAIVLLIYMIEMGKKIVSQNIYKNFVSSTLIDKIAKENNINVIDVPIGPKWYGNLIGNDKKHKTLFAYEESCGFIMNELLCDKDAPTAIPLICESFNHYYSLNMDFNMFYEKYIYDKYGYLCDDRISLFFSDSYENKNIINSIIDNIRNKINENFLGEVILKKVDYLKTKIKLYQSNLIKIYIINNDSWVAVRPSGTEVKIKFYINIVMKDKDECIKKFNEIKSKIQQFVDSYK